MRLLNKILTALLVLGPALAFANSLVPVNVPAVSSGLQERDLDGDGEFDAYYDVALDITWLRDWTAQRLNWADALLYAEAFSFAGYGDWRLPTLSPVNGSEFVYNSPTGDYYTGSIDLGYATTGVGWGSASEIGHLFYVSLANLGRCAGPDPGGTGDCLVQPGFGWVNKADFLFPRFMDAVWTDQEFGRSSPPISAWVLQGSGSQTSYVFSSELVVALVADGDIAAVPEAGSMYLLSLGLLVLLWRRTASMNRSCNVPVAA